MKSIILILFITNSLFSYNVMSENKNIKEKSYKTKESTFEDFKNKKIKRNKNKIRFLENTNECYIKSTNKKELKKCTKLNRPKKNLKKCTDFKKENN